MCAKKAEKPDGAASSPSTVLIDDVIGALAEVSAALPGGGPLLLEDMLRSIARRAVTISGGPESFSDAFVALEDYLQGRQGTPVQILRTENSRLRVAMDEKSCPYSEACRNLGLDGVARVCTQKLFCEQAVSVLTGSPAGGVLLAAGDDGRCVFELYPVSSEMLSQVDRLKRNADAAHHQYHLTRSRLNQVQTRHKAILESIADAIVVVDSSFEVVYINPRACGVFALTVQDAVGARFEKGSCFGRIGDLCVDAIAGLEGAAGEATIENSERGQVHNVYHVRFSPFECLSSRDRHTLMVLEDVTREELLRRELAAQAASLELTVDEKTRELKEANARLQTLAQTDPLTGLANRRMFEEILNKELKRAGRTGHKVGIIVADIDGFKAVNDICGHQAGDQVLVHLAKILLNSVRESDTVARWGGDEFIALLPHAGREECAGIAERMQHDLDAARKTIVPPGGPGIGLSAGWASNSRADADRLIATADRMMYARKGRRKARTVSDAS